MWEEKEFSGKFTFEDATFVISKNIGHKTKHAIMSWSNNSLPFELIKNW